MNYMENNLKTLATLLPGVRENIPLAPYSAWKTGGPARYFFIARSRIEIISAVEASLAAKIPFVVFGGGSHVLISDSGFDGLVIVLRNNPQKPWTL